MIGFVHLTDGGLGGSIRAMRNRPAAGTPGLRHACAVVAAPLGGGPPRPQLGRFGLVAFWDDDDALDRYLETDRPLDRGWSARLDPVRAVPVASGHFPGVPVELPRGPVSDPDGVTAVLTIGRLRLRRTVPFLRASARAEKQVAESPGAIWATGLTDLAQRVVATFSLWHTAESVRAYATSTAGHAAAMGAEHRRTFHHQGSFVRFRPYAVRGRLDGRNPLDERVAELVSDPA